VNEHQRHRTFDQQHHVARLLLRPPDSRLCEALGKPSLRRRLVTPGNSTSRMAGEIGKLDQESGES
jgi:hypothetical protein